MKTLIVCALKEEYSSDEYDVVYTGMGKINALIAMSKVLLSKYDRVINLGSCGSEMNVGMVVQPCLFYEWDRKVPEGYQPSRVIHCMELYKRLPQVPCASGDSFVADTSGKGMLVYDMEAYALARFCEEHDKKFLSFKYVSDSGSAKQWKESLPLLKRRFDLVLKDVLMTNHI